MHSDIELLKKVGELAREGHWDAIEEIIDANPGLAVETPMPPFDPVLVRLSRYAGSSRLLQKLIDLGADPNYHGKDGSNALASAISGGSTYGLTTMPELRVLLQGGANPNQRADAGYPALHWAIVLNRLEHAKLLLEFGADPYEPTIDYTQETAFDVAKRVENMEALALLEGWKKLRKQQL